MDSKSIVPKGRVGSSPTFGTLSTFTFRNFFNLRRLRNVVFLTLSTGTKTETKLGFWSGQLAPIISCVFNGGTSVSSYDADDTLSAAIKSVDRIRFWFSSDRRWR